jgi:dipeptidyl-peptidase-4
MRCLVSGAWGLMFAALALGAQERKRSVTLEWMFSDSAAQATTLASYAWLRDGTAMVYDRRVAPEERTFERLDPASGKRAGALDMRAALASLREARSGAETPNVLDWPVQLDSGGQRAVYAFDGDLFLLELPTARFRRLTRTDSVERVPRLAPDGSKVAFVRANDLYVYDFATNAEVRLTTDGSATILNGTLSWVYWEEIFGRQDVAYWWSPDSRALAFLRTDESPVGIAHFLDHRPQYPRLITQRYPKVGTANPIVRVGVVELPSARTTWLDLGSYEYVIRVAWIPGAQRLAVQTMNRAQDSLWLRFASRAKGDATLILTETDPGWVNTSEDLYFLKDGKHFLWSSERTGYAHLYRYTMRGNLVNPVTSGEWAVQSSGTGAFWIRRTVSAIDERAGWVYFTAGEKSSLERHLYRVRLDGSRMHRLTKENGTHRIGFAPSGRFYFDRHSSLTSMPQLTLRRADGERVLEVAASRPELLAAFDIRMPELLSIPTGDGFRMPAFIFRPRDFTPAKRYPVILDVYGGPSAPTVANGWYFLPYDHILADRGYVVVRVDNRAATGISKRLENMFARQGFGGVWLTDLFDAVRWLKAQSWVDGGRIGIWGWSGGGTYTLAAMTHSADFKAGIAVAPVTDWRYYDTKWAEPLSARPHANTNGGSPNETLLDVAKNLSGRLLLVHGTYDDNVHPQNSWAFIDQLISAGKTFEMMWYPMRQHGISDDAASMHLYKTMIEFWERNL